MTFRLGVAAAAITMCAMFGAAGAAIAQDDATLPESPEESRAILEQSCLDDDGMDAETCSCLGDFVATNFSDRELAGAAFVFSTPLYTTDPAAGIGALLTAGFSLEEITAVANRVMTLEEAATTECAVESAPAETNEN